MSVIIQTVLALIGQLLPALGGNSGLVEKIVASLIQIVPVIIQEYKDLLPMVKNIVTALKADPASTPAQIEALQALDDQVDQAFEAAAAAALAEDAS